MKITSKILSVVLVLAMALGMFAIVSFAAESKTYQKVTDASTLKAGDQLVLVSTNKAGNMTFAAGVSENGKYLLDAEGTIEAVPAEAAVFTLGGAEGAWTLTCEGKKLSTGSTKNLGYDKTVDTWTIAIDDEGGATIQSTVEGNGRILYNVSSPRFTTYTSNTSSSMLLPILYKLTETTETEQPETPDPETPDPETPDPEETEPEATEQPGQTEQPEVTEPIKTTLDKLTTEDVGKLVTVEGLTVKEIKQGTKDPAESRYNFADDKGNEITLFYIKTFENVKQGDTVTVTAYVSEYNGNVQFDNKKEVEIVVEVSSPDTDVPPTEPETKPETPAPEVTEPETPAPETNKPIKTTLDNLTTEDVGKLVTVEGLTVKEVKQGTKDPAESRYTFADDKGNEITLFYIKTFENVKQGDTVTVTAYVSEYNGNVQFDNKKEVEIVVDNNSTDTEVQPTEPEATEPETKPEEKPETKPEIPAKTVLSMKIPGKTVYFNGKIVNGRFLGTTTNSAEAVEVVKEAKGDGFYLRVKDGKYISVQQTEYKDKNTGEMKKGVQVALTDKAETVYTLDSKLGIMKTTVGTTEYYLGSYTNKEGKTFDTISASKSSYVKTDNIGKTQFAAKVTTIGGSAAQTGDSFSMVAVVTALVAVSALAVVVINRKKFNA